MSDDVKMRVISLGAGVQSSTMALMATRGEIGPMPDCAIFADTMAEPQTVYEHLDWLEKQLPFPVHRVSGGDLRQNTLSGRTHSGHPFIDIPVHVQSPDGKRVITRRQCTGWYKIIPLRTEVKRLLMLRLNGRQRPSKNTKVEQWIGISTDESMRMKESGRHWQVHRWPLIEAGISRQDCKDWFAERYPGRTLPRSACTFCPYHNSREWREMRDNDPVSWEDALSVDRALRTTIRPEKVGLNKGDEMFLSSKVVPLEQSLGWGGGVIDMEPELDLFNEECEGMCGV